MHEVLEDGMYPGHASGAYNLTATTYLSPQGAHEAVAGSGARQDEGDQPQHALGVDLEPVPAGGPGAVQDHPCLPPRRRHGVHDAGVRLCIFPHLLMCWDEDMLSWLHAT